MKQVVYKADCPVLFWVEEEPTCWSNPVRWEWYKKNADECGSER